MGIYKWYWGGIRDAEIRNVYLYDIATKIRRMKKSKCTPMGLGEKFTKRAGMFKHEEREEGVVHKRKDNSAWIPTIKKGELGRGGFHEIEGPAEAAGT